MLTAHKGTAQDVPLPDQVNAGLQRLSSIASIRDTLKGIFTPKLTIRWALIFIATASQFSVSSFRSSLSFQSPMDADPETILQ